MSSLGLGQAVRCSCRTDGHIPGSTGTAAALPLELDAQHVEHIATRQHFVQVDAIPRRPSL